MRGSLAATSCAVANQVEGSLVRVLLCSPTRVGVTASARFATFSPTPLARGWLPTMRISDEEARRVLAAREPYAQMSELVAAKTLAHE